MTIVGYVIGAIISGLSGFADLFECNVDLDTKYRPIEYDSMYKCVEDGRGNALLFHGPKMPYDGATYICKQFDARLVEIYDADYNELILKRATEVCSKSNFAIISTTVTTTVTTVPISGIWRTNGMVRYQRQSNRRYMGGY